jgi:nickel-dependent lactate racemase
MVISVPYGSGHLSIPLPPGVKARVLETRVPPGAAGTREAIREALIKPIGAKRISESAPAGGQAVIIINDITRPTPTRLMVQEILEELDSAGVRRDDVTVVVATGSHRPATPGELLSILGDDLARSLRVENHDWRAKDLVFLGTTTRGVPLYINAKVARASYKIVTGVILPHQAAGYSGGRKSILPGVAGEKTLVIHHSLPIRMFDPAPGIIHGNPFHEEAQEAALKVGVDFMLNVIPVDDSSVVAAVAGHIVQAFEAGVRLAEDLYTARVERAAGVVVVSPGGYPRDIDLYQSVKALSIAQMVVEDGGNLVLVAECREGVGRGAFYQWFKDASSPRDVVERFRLEGFTEGTNTAFMLARALLKARVLAVSSGIGAPTLRDMFMEPVPSLNEALEAALVGQPRGQEVLVLPNPVRLVPSVGSAGSR